MEFKKVRDLIPPVNVNISTTNKYVAEVERRIQTIKEMLMNPRNIAFQASTTTIDHCFGAVCHDVD